MVTVSLKGVLSEINHFDLFKKLYKQDLNKVINIYKRFVPNTYKCRYKFTDNRPSLQHFKNNESKLEIIQV